MIKGVVFDLDHTLFDRYGTLTECAPLYYEKFKDYLAPGLEIEDVVTTLIYADKEYIYMGEHKRVCQYLNESGFFAKPMEPDLYVEIIFEGFRQWAVPLPFTYTVLEEIKKAGYKVGLITNGRENVQQPKIDMLGIKSYFDEIIICSTPELRKPNALAFEIMSEKLGIPASELVYVGDNPKNDVDASRNAGYIPIWVNTCGKWQFDDIKRADYEIDTVADLFEILNNLNA